MNLSMNPWIVLVSAAALLFYIAACLTAARFRGKYGLPAPAMSGQPDVERALRVQGNTLEWLVVFLPALWMFAPFWGAYLGAGLGVVWILGRILYMVGYLKAAESRKPGFLIQGVVIVILLSGDIAGAVRALSAG
ncbi:MAG TPA: MAPEG family protein [Caulobacteraceae bacterium]|nr:MAPEG family protein [Caulobacteraceae bacterium]